MELGYQRNLSRIDMDKVYFTKQGQKAKRTIDLAVVASPDIIVGEENR